MLFLSSNCYSRPFIYIISSCVYKPQAVMYEGKEYDYLSEPRGTSSNGH